MNKHKKRQKKDTNLSKNKELLEKIPPKQLKNLQHILEDYKAAHGLVVRSTTVQQYFHGISTTLFPMMIKDNVFKYALALQNDISSIFDKISINTVYIIENTRKAKLQPNFINKMLYMYVKSADKNTNNKLRAHIIRTTYNIEESTKSSTPTEKVLKFHSIETCSFNSVSFSSCIGPIHSRLIDYINYGIGQFVAIVWNEYRKRNFSTDQSDTFHYILIVVEPNNVYSVDQIKLSDCISECINSALEAENNLFKQERPRIFCVTFMQLKNTLILDENNGNLYYCDPQQNIPSGEVSIVYFNTGDKSHHYPNDSTWETRSKIEFSNAIKIPTLGMQLLKYIDISKEVYSTDSTTNSGFFKPFKDKLSNLFSKSIHYDDNPSLFEKLLTHAANEPDLYVIRNKEGDLVKGDKLTHLIENYEKESDPKIMEGVSIQKQPTLIRQHNYVKLPLDNDFTLIECTPLLSIWGLYIHDSKKEIYNRIAGYSCFCKCLNNESNDKSLVHSSALLY